MQIWVKVSIVWSGNETHTDRYTNIRGNIRTCLMPASRGFGQRSEWETVVKLALYDKY